MLDLHVDRDHHRCVYTLVGERRALEDALAAAAAVAVDRIDLTVQRGVHPRVGAMDVVPVVALEPERREEARAMALRVADRIAELGVPVFLYADSGRRPAARTTCARAGPPASRGASTPASSSRIAARRGCTHRRRGASWARGPCSRPST